MNTCTRTLLWLLPLITPVAGCSKQWVGPAMPEHMNEAAAIAKAQDLVRSAQRLEQSDKENEAMLKYQEAIRTYRELPVAWNNLGRLKMRAGDNLAASEAFKQATDLSPSDPVAPYNLGQLWESLNYPEDASRWYTESLSRDPNYLPALRRSVLVDMIRNMGDERTSDRLKRALLQETDPAWKERLLREEIRLRESLATKAALPR